MTPRQRFISLVTYLGICAVFAQMIAFSQTIAPNPLVGTWQTSIELGQGQAPATGMFQVLPDGRYREEIYIQNQLAAFWEGSYSLTPDGTLTQQESNKSPQICVQGQCVANDGSGLTVSRVSMQGPDSFVMTLQDASSQFHTVTWQRLNTQAVTPSQQVSPQQHPIVGTWHYIEYTQQGNSILSVLTYTPDGRFDIRSFLNGQALMSSYGGTYTVDANNTLVETTTEKSPQHCYLQCQPNPVQLGISAPMQIGFADMNTLIYAGLKFQRGQGMPTVGGTHTPTPSLPGSGGGVYPMPTVDNGGFVDGVIWGQSPFQTSDGSGTFMLPDSPDPSTTYYSPNGNPLNYNDVTNTWTEVSPNGFETEITPAGE